MPGRLSRRLVTFVSVVMLVALSVPSLGLAAAPVQSETAPAPAPGGQVHSFDPAASFPLSALTGRAQLQTVFPPDERVRVTPTTKFPASAVTYVLTLDQNDDPITECSGTLIGRQVVLTAAHCIYDPEWGGWVDTIGVVPGMDADVRPFGVFTAADAFVPDPWYHNQDDTWDFALIKLPVDAGTPAGGWFKVGVLNTQSLNDAHFRPTIVGYPADKPWGTQWAATKESFVRVEAQTLYTDIDVFPGQSGSAVWRSADGMIVGLIVRQSGYTNAANRIDQQILDWMTSACAAMRCEFDSYVEPPPPPVPAPAPSAIGSDAFLNTWSRTDGLVALGQASRTWMWGPQGYTPVFAEPYGEGPGGQRLVQYFDKSRMEITNPNGDPNSLWYVTNGLLSLEMVVGVVQLGDNALDFRTPAQINVAGDPDDPIGPTYATLTPLRTVNPLPVSALVTQTLDRAGQVGNRPDLGAQGITATILVPETNHTVASPFWDFMNSQGLVQQAGQTIYDRLFVNPFYATGYPITEPYWAQVKVGGVVKDVLVQCFERRCLTYTPSNAAGWQVEAGNVGQHYYRWRYGQ